MIHVQIAEENPIPLGVTEETIDPLLLASGVTESRLQEVLTDYVPKSDIDSTLSIEGDVAEAKATGDAIAEINAKLSDILPSDSASGSIASFPDGAKDFPLKSLEVDIEPVQDLHGQSAPYPAGGGKNKTSYTDAFVGAVGENLHPTLFTLELKAGTYTFSCKQSVTIPTSTRNTLEVAKQSESPFARESTASNFNPTNLKHSLTFTAPEDGTYAFLIWSHTPSVSATYTEWQVEAGSSATSYAPYSNICPITGWNETNVVRTGVNVWDGTSEEGYIDMNTGNELPNASQSRSLFVPIKPSTSYKFVNSNASTGVRMAFYDANKTFISNFMNGNANPQNFTTPTNAQYLRFYWGDITKVSINYPNTDSTYHEPKSNAYTIPLPFTVYGGTLDVTNGTLVVDRAIVDLGSLGWASRSTSITGKSRFGVELADALLPTNSGNVADMICTNYKTINSNQTYQCNIGISGDLANNNNFIFVYDPTYETSTPAQFKTAMSGVKLVYKLKTPETITLTPTQVKTLLGDNNIFADSGSVSVVYHADIGKYIDKRIGA